MMGLRRIGSWEMPTRMIPPRLGSAALAAGLAAFSGVLPGGAAVGGVVGADVEDGAPGVHETMPKAIAANATVQINRRLNFTGAVSSEGTRLQARR